jgi:DNA mismatch repair protein MutH
MLATEMNEEKMEKSPKDWERKIQQIFLGKGSGVANEVGEVLFLCSKDASWIRGETFVVDGSHCLT